MILGNFSIAPLNHADKQRSVAHRNDNVGRNSTELLERFVDVSLHAFIEEGIKDVVGVKSAIIFYLCAANISAMITSARYNINFGTVRLDHGDFFRTCAFGRCKPQRCYLHCRLSPERNF